MSETLQGKIEETASLVSEYGLDGMTPAAIRELSENLAIWMAEEEAEELELEEE